VPAAQDVMCSSILQACCSLDTGVAVPALSTLRNLAGSNTSQEFMVGQVPMLMQLAVSSQRSARISFEALGVLHKITTCSLAGVEAVMKQQVLLKQMLLHYATGINQPLANSSMCCAGRGTADSSS